MNEDAENHRVKEFGEQIDNTIDQFRREWDISLAEVVGTLLCASVFLILDAYH